MSYTYNSLIWITSADWVIFAYMYTWYDNKNKSGLSARFVSIAQDIVLI